MAAGKSGGGKQSPRVHVVESDDKAPRVRLTPGKRYDVIVTSVVDNDLKAVSQRARPPRPPRLCGSRSTCVAIVEVDLPTAQ